MKINIVFFLFLLYTPFFYGQNYKSDFEKYARSADTVNQLKVLKEWESVNPTDAELFTSYFNYYFLKSKKEMLALRSDEPNEEFEGLLLQDSSNNTAGYLTSETYYDQIEIEKALNKIDEGIKLYPNRLDMRFGKIYVLGTLSDWDAFTSEIIKTIQYSSTNMNEWTWTENEKQENGQEFFINSLQDYQVQLYETDDDELLENMREIAKEILKYYPNNVESLSNISISYLVVGDYENGITPLLLAEKINPKDDIVLSNIAYAYKLKGDKKAAIEYYQKTIKYGDEQSKQFAKEQIDLLKK